MIHIIWRFRAKLDQVGHFRRIYGEDGEWAKLFSHSPDYRGTLLLQDTSDPLLFMVIDRWSAGESFTIFRKKYGREYELLDQQCLELTDEETLVGHFVELTA